MKDTYVKGFFKDITHLFSKREYSIGLDVGGTEIKAVLITHKKKIVSNINVATKKDETLNQIFEIIEKLIDGAKDRGISGIGIGIPGTLDEKKEKIIKCSNLNSLNNILLKKIITQKFGIPTYLEHDTNCMAISKCAREMKKGVKNIVYLSLGTGIGGAIIVNGKFYAGRGNAGEIGHMTIESEGPFCSCGNKGCLEEYVTKRGIKAIAHGLDIEKSPKEIFLMAKNKDEKAIKIFEIAGKFLGIGLSNLVKCYDPDLILIGGGISNAGDFLIKPAISEMKKRTFFPVCPVKQSTQHKYEGALGAANLPKLK